MRASTLGADALTGALATGALPVALLVLGIGMSLGGPTGYAINPARDLGPRIMHAILPIPGKGGSDWAYSWIPVVGPIVGGVIGALRGQGDLRPVATSSARRRVARQALRRAEARHA